MSLLTRRPPPVGGTAQTSWEAELGESDGFDSYGGTTGSTNRYAVGVAGAS